MASLLTDVRYAFRTMHKQPGLSLVVAVTLALGIGINATMFGMMDAMLLRPFRFPDQHRLVILWEALRGTGDRDTVASATFLDWRSQARAVEPLAAWEWWDATLTSTEGGDRQQGFRVSAGFFEMLGVTPSLGRAFSPDEENPGRHRVVVIGDGLWRQRFGADPAIIGTDVLLGHETYTIIGVAPPAFDFPVGAQIWAPLAFGPARIADRERRSLTVAGKLAAGRTRAEAQAEMDVIGRRLEQQYPATNRDRVVAVQSLSTAFRDESAAGLFAMLVGSAGLVLLVACMNIAGLLLARALDRQRELALRSALGATRQRIARQLVTETVLLALLSSILALVCASIGLNLLRSSLPAEITSFIEGWNHLRLDGRLLIVVPALALGVGLLVGVIPAVASLRSDSAEALKESGRGPQLGVRGQRARQTLVVAEIAFALALLIAAGLTVTGGIRLVSESGGFNPERLLSVQVPYLEDQYVDETSKREVADALLSRLEALGGVERATIANILPAAGWSPSVHVEIEGQPLPDAANRVSAGYRVVSPGYFETMEIPILRGRTFAAADREQAQRVALVSASFADRFWPGQDPVGRQLRLEGSRDQWVTVVGVAADVQMYNWWDGVDVLAVYLPIRQAPPPDTLHVAMRTDGDTGAVMAAVREAVRGVNPRFVLHGARTLRQAIEESRRTLTWLAWLMAICGGIGAVLAMIGVYSLMSYAVSQREHEFGVRLALGATSRDVLLLTLRQAVVLTGAGVGSGVLLALLAGRLMASSMAGLVSVDPGVFIAVVPGLAATALAAAYIPARRALSVDPAVVLRQ